MVEASLYRMCLSKMSNMLLTNYLRADTSPNPFLGYPPSAVSDLIVRICRDVSGQIKSSYLHLLLASGRIQDFKLNNLELETKDAEDIFHDLQSSEQILKSITIQDVFLEGSDIISNLGRLIRSSKSLKSVETCIGFPLRELSYSQSLTHLTINYVIIFDPTSYYKLHRLTHYNNSLRVLKLFKAQISHRLYKFIENIMEYCLGLIEIEFDLRETLEYIYEKNEFQKYKLQKTILGSDTGDFGKRADGNAVFIASEVCPDLQSLEIIPEDYSSIHALKNFRHITDLILYKPRWSFNDYREGVYPLLQIPHFGIHLTSLTLCLFSEVDFTSIGICCPNLEVLKVEYFSADNALNRPQYAFEKVVNLNLVTFNRPCEASTLRIILSNASALEELIINHAETLTDDVLDEILENKDVFSKLKNLCIEDCGLTVTGLKKLLARRGKKPDNVSVSSSSITAEEASNIRPMAKIFNFVELKKN